MFPEMASLVAHFIITNSVCIHTREKLIELSDSGKKKIQTLTKQQPVLGRAACYSNKKRDQENRWDSGKLVREGLGEK